MPTTKLDNALLISVIFLVICASALALAITREVFIHGFH